MNECFPHAETFESAAPVVQCAGSWSDFTECSASCGIGRQFQTFQVTQAASNGGAGCASQDGDVAPRRCDLDACPVDCEGGWSDWGACSVTCEGGLRSRTFVVTVADANGGETCTFAANHVQRQDCLTGACLDAVNTMLPAELANTTMPPARMRR
jgi:hypothetical protein